MKVEQLQILLAINSLDKKDYRLRDKVLEAVGEKGEEMSEDVFRRLIGEHEKWLESSRNRCPEGLSADRKKATCWCCGETMHRKDKCPNRDIIYCNQCKAFQQSMYKEERRLKKTEISDSS